MNYHDIKKCDLNNGDGVRVSLFVSGCDHHCPGCFNAQTWNPKSGIPFDAEAKAELFAALDDPYVSGVTWLGGDPLAPYNYNEILELSKEVREKFPDKTIWCYTGYSFDEIQFLRPQILDHIDVLVDGLFIEDLKDNSLRYRGSSNQKIYYLTK